MADKKPTTKKTASRTSKAKTSKPVVTDAMDLHKTLAEKQTDLSQAKRSHKAGELVNPQVLGQLRRDIARLKTAIRANELGKEK